MLPLPDLFASDPLFVPPVRVTRRRGHRMRLVVRPVWAFSLLAETRCRWCFGGTFYRDDDGDLVCLACARALPRRA